MRNTFFARSFWVCLSASLASICATGISSAQRATPPSPKEQLTLEEQAKLERLRQSGQAVYSIGSSACVVELDRLASERAASKKLAPADPALMRDKIETEMFFAQARLDVINNFCGATENLGDYAQTEAFLRRLTETCLVTSQNCKARRHY